MKRILVLGAAGQIGSELVPHLRSIYGEENVIAADIQWLNHPLQFTSGPLVHLDALDANRYSRIVKKYQVDTIFNMVALLSATSERNPPLAWKVNMGALMNSLEIARIFNCSVFTPSSIGAFGPTTPPDATPQDTIMRPASIYGICKLTGELLSDYYYNKYGVDSRSVRFPGIVSSEVLPGGGTTDYAVEIYYAAALGMVFKCPLPEGKFLDMMYMPDALTACVQLMEADPSKLLHRNAFNVTAMSFDPVQVYGAIRKRMPNFVMQYEIDPVKSRIADGWPNHMDDSAARQEWGWDPKWDLDAMTDDMLSKLTHRMEKGLLKPHLVGKGGTLES